MKKTTWKSVLSLVLVLSMAVSLGAMVVPASAAGSYDATEYATPATAAELETVTRTFAADNWGNSFYKINEQNFGRFDIVAVQKEKGADGKYGVALVELKYGSDSYSTASDTPYFKKHPRKEHPNEKIDLKIETASLGSGLLGHMADFYRFEQSKNYEEHLKDELCSIVDNYRQLDLCGGNWPNGIRKEEISDKPQIYVVTVGKNKNTCESFKRYMFSKNDDGTDVAHKSSYNVEDITGLDFRDPGFWNYHFLFSKDSGKNIDDLLEHNSYSSFEGENG